MSGYFETYTELYDPEIPDPPVPPEDGTTGGVTVTWAPLGWDYLPRYVQTADDGTLWDLLASLGQPAAAAMDVLATPAYTADPDTTPFDRLSWLAAVAGIDLSTVPDARKRAIIGDQDWRYRGSLTAIRARVGETLTGPRSVEIEFTAPDEISVTTFASQTPDAAATEAAIRAEIPAWMVATIVTDAAGQSYTNLAADYATYGDMSTTGKTYGTLSQEV